MRDRLSPAAREHLLAFADDEHLIGQQHAEWIGVAPFLEEDLAFCSIAQDELGHAATLYELLGDADVDALAFGRPPGEYRSCHLVELPCADWADALVRHWLYDLAEDLRWEALAGSSVAAVAAVVERAQREEEYHRRHADALVAPHARRPATPDERVAAAIARLLPLADAVVGAGRRRGRGRRRRRRHGRVGRAARRWRARVEAVAGPSTGPPSTAPTSRPAHAAASHFAAAARPHQRGHRPRPHRPLVSGLGPSRAQSRAGDRHRGLQALGDLFRRPPAAARSSWPSSPR